MMKRFLWSCTLVSFFLPGLSAWAYSVEDCICCHKKGSGESKLHISVDDYLSSVHGVEIDCLDCHQGVDDDRHTNLRGSAEVDCQQCHEQENLHGQNDKVSCSNCHYRHRIYGAKDTRSSLYVKNLGETCGRCHPNESKTQNLFSFLPSLQIVSHLKQDLAKSFDKGMCVGCHQGEAAHGEKLPINDQVCYKCHLPLGQNKALLGYLHTRAEWHEQPINFIAGYVYLIALVLLLFGGATTVFKRKRG
ncbi:MAG: hypothetical protein ACFFCW_23445 [Candidatus Hodarchaeota archaeon]